MKKSAPSEIQTHDLMMTITGKGQGNIKYLLFSDLETTKTMSTTTDEMSAGVAKIGLSKISEIPENSPEPTSPRTLDVIDEDHVSGDESTSTSTSQHRSKRANMVKKALTYFSDKSNRSMSEDNLFTR